MAARDGGRAGAPFEAAVVGSDGCVVLASRGWSECLKDARLAEVDREMIGAAGRLVAGGQRSSLAAELGVEGTPWTVHVEAHPVDWPEQRLALVCVLCSAALPDSPAWRRLGFWLTDTDWLLRHASTHLADLLGTTPRAMLGRHVMDFATPADRAFGTQQIAQRFMGQTGFLGARLQRQDGSLVDLAMASVPLLDANGQLGGLAGAVACQAEGLADPAAQAGDNRAVATIAAVSSHLVSARPQAEAIEAALAAAGEVLGLARVTLLQAAEDGQDPALRSRQVWCADGVSPRRGNADGHDAARLALLHAGQLVVGGSRGLAELLPPVEGDGADRAVLMAPVICEDRFWGVVSLEADRGDRVWAAAEMSAMRSLGTIMGAAIVRHQMTDERDRTLARLQLVLGRMPIACLATDLDCVCTYANPAAEALFGWRESELLGRTLLQTLVPIEVGDHLAGIYERMRRGDPVALSVNENITARGRRIICEWQNVPLREPDGAITGVLCMAQDVTERREAIEREHEAQRRFAAVANASPQSLVAVDAEGRVVLWNPAAEALTGYTANEVMGHQMPLEVADDPAEARAFAQRVLAGEPAHRVAAPIRRRDGTDLSLTISGAPLRDARGAVTGALFVSSDDSEQLRLKERAERGEQAYRDLADRLDLPVCQVDTDLRIAYANQATAELVSSTPAKLVGVDLLTLFQIEDQTVIMNMMSRLLRGEEVTTGTLHYPQPDGRVQRCGWTARAVRDPDGTVWRYQAIGQILPD